MMRKYVLYQNKEIAQLKTTNAALIEALEEAESEMKIALMHISPPLQPGIHHNLKIAWAKAHATLVSVKES